QLAALGDLGDAPLLHPWVPGQLEQRPRHRGGGGLVSGGDERDQLIAQLLVRQSLGVLRRGTDQQREQVLAAGELGVPSRLVDLALEEVGDLGEVAEDRKSTRLNSSHVSISY